MLDNVITVLGSVIVVICILGFIFFNNLRSSWANIIGIGGSFVILIGLVSAVACVLLLVTGVKEGTLFSLEGAGAALVAALLAAVCIFYMLHVMLNRCSTMAQRIMLPFVAYLLAAAFVWRLAAAVLLHLPMSSGEVSGSGGSGVNALPDTIYDERNNAWESLGVFGVHAEYQSNDGRRVSIYHANISGSNANTNAGNFHWW